MSRAFLYDIFLSHNSKDKLRVRALAERLKGAGLRVWFDEWIIQPGDDIYPALPVRGFPHPGVLLKPYTSSRDR
ncbi:MAG TPA: toll/interleukin-1 receptor domain-containing protein [Candidatus Kapabacteria bacterium]|nr:toll/interleukin-1 receptor domain-containing protein [Candidatus Kapabacteria bacterium]